MEVVAVLLILLYFVPAGIAYERKHNNKVSILILNIFLGWTLLGWVAALVWACTNDVKEKSFK